MQTQEQKKPRKDWRLLLGATVALVALAALIVIWVMYYGGKPSKEGMVEAFEYDEPPRQEIGTDSMEPHAIVTVAKLSPDDRVLAVGYGISKRITLFDTATKKFRHHLELDSLTQNVMQFTHDGRYVLIGGCVGDEHVTFQAYDVETGRTFGKRMSMTMLVPSRAMKMSRRPFFCHIEPKKQHDEPSIVVRDLETDEHQSYPVPKIPDEVLLDGQGKPRFLVWSYQEKAEIYRYDPLYKHASMIKDGNDPVFLEAQHPQPPDWALHCAIATNKDGGKALFFERSLDAKKERFYLWDAVKGESADEWECATSCTLQLAVRDDESVRAICKRTEAVKPYVDLEVWDPKGDKLLQKKRFTLSHNPNGAPQSFFYLMSHDGKTLYLVCRNGEIFAWSLP